MKLSESPVVTDAAVASLIRAALEEDLGIGDLTSDAVIQEGRTCLAHIRCKGRGVIAGIRVAEAVFHAVDPDIDFEYDCSDGARLMPGDHVAVVGGSATAILAAERTALNFLQHMSGIATATAEAVLMVEGTGVTILDTRKTTPGMRKLEKYAVAIGGGVNHRSGLYDAVLIKNNHIALAGGIAAAVARARERQPDQRLIVEARTRAELEAVLEAKVDRVLLDNFSPSEAAEGVALVGGRCEVEISGGVTRENLHAYAAAHPNYISLGYLTHSAPVLDLALRVVA